MITALVVVGVLLSPTVLDAAGVGVKREVRPMEEEMDRSFRSGGGHGSGGDRDEVNRDGGGHGSGGDMEDTDRGGGDHGSTDNRDRSDH